MSIAVPLEDLGAEVRRRGFGYLLTVDEDASPRAVALSPQVLDGQVLDGEEPPCVLRFRAGRGRTAATAAVRDDDGGAVVDVTPTWAVRHRPAP